MNNEIPLKTSLIKYDKVVNGGVSINIGISIYEFSFLATYWIHPNGFKILDCESNFLKLWGVSETESLPFYNELCIDIDSIISNKDEIFKEFNLN